MWVSKKKRQIIYYHRLFRPKYNQSVEWYLFNRKRERERELILNQRENIYKLKELNH